MTVKPVRTCLLTHSDDITEDAACNVPLTTDASTLYQTEKI